MTRNDEPQSRTMTEKLLGLIVAVGILCAGVALMGLMLSTDQNMIGIVVAVLLVVLGVRQLITVIRGWRASA